MLFFAFFSGHRKHFQVSSFSFFFWEEVERGQERTLFESDFAGRQKVIQRFKLNLNAPQCGELSVVVGNDGLGGSESDASLVCFTSSSPALERLGVWATQP